MCCVKSSRPRDAHQGVQGQDHERARGGRPDGRGVDCEIEELEIQRQLAERFYALAQADLDRAQQEPLAKTLPERVRSSLLAEESRYPRRFAFSLLTFVALTVVWPSSSWSSPPSRITGSDLSSKAVQETGVDTIRSKLPGYS